MQHRLHCCTCTSLFSGGVKGGGGGAGSADPRNFSAKSIDVAIKRSAVRLQLCFESVIRTIFLPKSESITFIGYADQLKLLLKSAIRTKILAKSADPQTLSPSPFSLLIYCYISFLPARVVADSLKRICASKWTITKNNICTAT